MQALCQHTQHPTHGQLQPALASTPPTTCCAVLCCAGVCLLQVMWSIGVTALLVSSVVMTALVAYLDHFDMPSVEEAAATQEMLQLLTPQQQQAGPEDPGTRLSMQRSAATSLSGIMSPPHQFEQQGSGHQSPSGPGSQQQIALVQQGRKDSAAQVSRALGDVGCKILGWQRQVMLC